MTAKNSLIATLRVLDDCLNDQALIDKAPTDVAHNARASMLRQGLAVLMFSTIETFIRERTGEVLQLFSNPLLSFSDLPPPLQKATTLGALDGVRFRSKLQPAGIDRINWLVGSVSSIASTATSVSSLSIHSFGYSASNLSELDVKDILKAFGIENPWAQLTSLSHRLGVAIPDAESEFIAIKERRHASAHALTANVPHTDLSSSARSALAICIGFDLLLSHARSLINARHCPGQNGNRNMTHLDLKLVFVNPRPNTTLFEVRKEQLPPPNSPSKRLTIRVLPNEQDAISIGRSYANRHQTHFVVLDSTSTPTQWETL